MRHYSAQILAATALSLLLTARAAPSCTPDGVRCSGASNRPFIKYIGCCGQWPQVKCLPHPGYEKNPEKYWGRFCLEAPKVPSHPLDSSPSYAMPTPSLSSAPSSSYHRPGIAISPVTAPSSTSASTTTAFLASATALATAKTSRSHLGTSTPASDPAPDPAPKMNGTGVFSQNLATYPVREKEILIPDKFTADPSAHVVDGRVVVWASHDVPVATAAQDETQFMMKDYAMFSFNKDMSKVTDHGFVLPISSVPWAEKMMWAPDAKCRDGKCYLYFPAKDYDGIFRIGVAVADEIGGPYKAEPLPIPGSYSIDPAVFEDDDGSVYMWLGGDWGGQLHNWVDGTFDASKQRPTQGDALRPMLAKMSGDLKTFATKLEPVDIVDKSGKLLQAGDLQRRFFEGAWCFKRNGMYYLMYSTGETHKIVYATSQNIAGPYTYEGDVLGVPQGWTNHASSVEYAGKTYLFYHDSKQSGKTPLRNVKMQEMMFLGDKIVPMEP